MAGVFAPQPAQTDLRKELKKLRRGQARTVHFAEDQDSVKTALLRVMRDHEVRAVVVEAPRHRTREQPRDVVLRQVARASLAYEARMITLDRDDSRVTRDNKVLFEELSKAEIQYCHRKSYEEPLLWTADAIAWAWHRDRHWRARVEEFVVDLVKADG